MTNHIYHVTCSCGLDEYFEDPEDADDVFMEHGNNRRCGTGKKESKYLNESGEVDPEQTLPPEL